MPAVVLAGAPLAPQPGLRRRHRLQLAGRLSARGPARSRRPQARLPGAAHAPRDPPDDLLGDRRRADADHPSQRGPRPQRRRPAPVRRRRPAHRGAADPQGGVALPVQPRQGPRRAADRDPTQRHGSHPDAQHAPCRDRRLFAQRALSRPDRVLRGVRRRAPAGAAGARRAVRGLRDLAARMARRGHRRPAARVLEAQARAGAVAARPADRLRPPAGPLLGRRLHQRDARCRHPRGA